MRQISMCYCGEPLVGTFAFSGQEWVCVICGTTYRMFEPNSVDETPKLRARAERHKRGWLEIAHGYIGGGAMLKACDTCHERYEPHLFHATDDEKAAHEAAAERIAAIGAA